MDKFQFANMRVEGISRGDMDEILEEFCLAVQEVGGIVGGGYEIVKDSDGKKEDRAV